MESPPVPNSSGTVMLFDLRVYPLIAIQKASYEVLGNVRCLIQLLNNDEASVSFEPLTSPEQLVEAMGAFVRRVSDLTLQTRINSETREVREALVRAALFESLRH